MNAETPQAQQAQTLTWDDVRAPLRDVLGDAFERWFQPITATVEGGGDRAVVLRVLAPNAFHCSWIREHYRTTLEAIWRGQAPDGQVIFIARDQPAPTPPQLPAKVMQLPLFPADTRPTSNDLARSALFAAIKGKDRQRLHDVEIATVDGIKILFDGEQLNQDDHDTLMQLVFMAQHTPLGEEVTVPAHTILKALGRGTAGKEHEQLKAEITRLVKGSLTLKAPRFEYIGHLLDDAGQDKCSKYWVYRINPKLKDLFGLDQYTLIDWQQRKNLKRKDLARWLQLYLATHAAPFPVSVEFLRTESGSRTAELWKFRQLLRAALEELEKNHDIQIWEIDANDLVYLDRGKAISDSQRRSLANPKGKRRRKTSARVSR
jgi:TrfA protein/DnaA N-terminal domain